MWEIVREKTDIRKPFWLDAEISNMSASKKHALSNASIPVSNKVAKLVTKSKIEEIKSLAKHIIKSKKHCNDVLQLFEEGEVSQDLT